MYTFWRIYMFIRISFLTKKMIGFFFIVFIRNVLYLSYQIHLIMLHTASIFWIKCSSHITKRYFLDWQGPVFSAVYLDFMQCNKMFCLIMKASRDLSKKGGIYSELATLSPYVTYPFVSLATRNASVVWFLVWGKGLVFSYIEHY